MQLVSNAALRTEIVGTHFVRNQQYRCFRHSIGSCGPLHERQMARPGVNLITVYILWTPEVGAFALCLNRRHGTP